MGVELVVGDANGVLLGEPLDGVVVDLDSHNPGHGNPDHHQRHDQHTLPSQVAERSKPRQRAGQCAVTRRPCRVLSHLRQALQRAPGHGHHDVGRDQGHRKEPGQGHAERHVGTEDLDRRNGRETQRPEAGDGREARVQHGHEQVAYHVPDGFRLVVEAVIHVEELA